MPRLSKSQAETRRRVIAAAASGLSPSQLSNKFMQTIGEAIPFDGYRLFAVDPSTLLVNRLLAASDNDSKARLNWLRDVYLRTDALYYSDLPTLIRGGLAAVALQEHQRMCWGYPPDVISHVSEGDHYRLYHEYSSPVGGALLASFSVDGKAVAVLQAYRRNASRQFRSGEVAFMRLIGPVVAQALAVSLRQERTLNGSSTSSPDASGIILVNGGGGVIFATPAGEAWSDVLAAHEGAGEKGVATSIWSAIAKMRTNGSPVARVITTTTSGPIQIEATPGGADQSVAIVISKDRPPVPPDVPEHWSLTAQERRIVEHVLRGAGNREIADALFISDKTVEWHLWHVFEKLGVSSRGQLLSRYFEETHLATASASEAFGA